MRLDWALPANSAEASPNAVVHILGAGFDTLIRDPFPTPFGGVIVLSGPQELDQLQRFDTY
jgi:hypothetical protein